EERFGHHGGHFRLAAGDLAPAADALVGVDAVEALRAGRERLDGGDLDVAALVGDPGRRVGVGGGVLGHEEAGRGEGAAGGEDVAARQAEVSGGGFGHGRGPFGYLVRRAGRVFEVRTTKTVVPSRGFPHNSGTTRIVERKSAADVPGNWQSFFGKMS